jgi:tetratricopeptide (TPR) repeat protein
MAFFRYLRIFLFTILILSVVYPTYSQENDSEKAKALNQQVIKLYRQGRYQEAIKIAEKVLAISEKALGPDHPRVATSLNALALLYYSLGDYAKAEPLYKRSLVIWDFQNTRKTKKIVLFPNIGVDRDARKNTRAPVSHCRKSEV